MLIYNQKTGLLTRDLTPLGSGYSGRGAGRNNPRMQGIRSIGPIPCGEYQIGPAYDTRNLGPVSIPLTPIGHDAMGRSGFFVHGDNSSGDASHGCIVLPRPIRDQIARLRKSGESLLVISGEPEPEQPGPEAA